jgi:phosphatidyl-myo-inositol dimannoside synthase
MSTAPRTPANVVVSYDFLPKIGGAHSWLYETYRRWHSPVQVVTLAPARDEPERREQQEFDAQQHGQLGILRRLAPLAGINLLDPRCALRFWAHRGEISRAAGSGHVVLHALRAFPEGISAALVRMSRGANCSLVTYAHGEELLIAQTSRQLRLAARLAYEKSNLVIVNSESTRRLVLEVCPSVRTECIHPGVDADLFKLDARQIEQQRADWNVAPGEIVIATVARMEPRKNHEAVLRALLTLRREGLAVSYVCAGDGEQRAHLEELVRSLGLQPWVRLLGRVTDAQKRAIFAAADIHAMPSVQSGSLIEGFGIVFLEAAAAGRPSVCGKIGGQSEAVLDGETGLVVDGADEGAVAGALRRLAMDAGLRTRMGENGRRWAQRHDWPQTVAKTRAAIEAALGFA